MTLLQFLSKDSVLPDSLYNEAVKLIGEQATAELLFLISAYAMLAIILNGFDVQA